MIIIFFIRFSHNTNYFYIHSFLYCNSFVLRMMINYADAEQSALEIRTDFVFFFFMVVANCNASCYWLHVHCSQW